MAHIGSKYDPLLTPLQYEDYLSNAREQYSTEELARLLGVHPSTLNAWISKYPAMRQAQEHGRERRRLAFIKEAKRGLFKQLCGYDVEETRTVIVEGNIKEQHITRRHIPANVAAAIFVLCNMQPEEWTRSNTRTLDFEDNNRRAFTVKVIDNTADRVAGAKTGTRKKEDTSGDGTAEITP